MFFPIYILVVLFRMKYEKIFLPLTILIHLENSSIKTDKYLSLLDIFMNYKEKYHKYKTKYIKLKNYISNNIFTSTQIGGKIFQKKQILYIVATISQAKLKKTTKEITDTILGKNVKPYRAPHITLFNLIINANNIDNGIFQNQKLYDLIESFYAEMIANKNDPLILEAKTFPHDFSFTGYRPRHFVKNYKPINRQKILDFKHKIFGQLETMLGKFEIRDHIDNTGARYHVYSFNGQELFAESTYYDVWKPHINFLNEFDIQKHNPDLYEELHQYYSGAAKVAILTNYIKDIPQQIYQNINMATQMKNITYAIDKFQKKFKT